MKVVSVKEAIARIPNGATVMVGGIMGVTPELDELVRQRKSELSIISNDAAVPGKGVGKLFDAALVSTLTTSHIMAMAAGTVIVTAEHIVPVAVPLVDYLIADG